MNRMRGGAAAWALALAAVMAAAPAEATILSHKAVYRLTLVRAAAAGSIQGMSGEMTLKVDDLCEGLALNQYLLTDFWQQDGVLHKGELTSSSWEDRDGLSMRFTLTNKNDGTLVQAFEGEARREAAGKAGLIVYKDNSYAETALPKEALFPRQHLAAMLQAAKTGRRALESVVFDGAEEGKVYATTAIIGGEHVSGPGDATRPELSGLTYWPVVLSYFPVDSKEPLPEYQTSFNLYENGVSADLVLDFGDFALKGRLDSLEIAAPADCE